MNNNKPLVPEVLRAKFFSDPDWAQVEELILNYINPLIEMDSVDTNQSAETVKAEVIGRRLAYEKLYQFLTDTQLVSSQKLKAPKRSPFR